MAKQELNCPVTTIINLIGGKYKALIVWHLVEKTLRFGEIQKIVVGATPKMLTQQLRELERDGIVSRNVYPVVPPKVEYSLTENGKQLIPILKVMYSCGEDILKRQGRSPNCSMKLIKR